jgi:hypothetical protein
MCKKIFKISLLIFALFSVISCSDTLNSDGNVKVITDDGSSGLSKILEYRFYNDQVSFQNNDTTVMWSAPIPYVWGKTFYIVNISKDTIVEIKNIKLLDGKYYTVAPRGSVPVQISPNQTNTANLFVIQLSTKDLKPGIYIDKVIINDIENIGFYIKISVY